jgi:hypothetical protein
MSRPIPKDDRRKRLRQNSEDADDSVDPRDVRKRSNFSRDRDGGRGDRDSRDRDNSRGETKESREAREAMMYVWENRELFVGNILAAGVTEDSLREYLNRAMKESGLVTPGSEDPISSCRLSGKYGFLEFANANDCTKALNLNGIPYMGSNLKIGRPAKYSGPVKFGITWQQLTSGDPNILNRLTAPVNRNPQGMHPPASADMRKAAAGGLNTTAPTGKGFRNIGNVHTRIYREIFIGNTTIEMEDEALKEFLGELLFKLGLSSNGMYHPIMEVKNSGKFAFLITRTIEDCANLLNLSGVPFLGHKLKFERPSRFEGEISTIQYYTWDDVYNTLYLSSELKLMTSVVQNQYSRIVRMINLAPLQEIIQNTSVYLELMEDVRNTCAQFGTVKSVIIPRTGATGSGNASTRTSGGNGEEGVCKVFVEMSTIPEARAVVTGLKGRTFNHRYVDMKMYPEDKFRALNYHYEFPGQILTASHGMVMKEQIFVPTVVQKIQDALENPKNIVTSN